MPKIKMADIWYWSFKRQNNTFFQYFSETAETSGILNTDTQKTLQTVGSVRFELTIDGSLRQANMVENRYLHQRSNGSSSINQ